MDLNRLNEFVCIVKEGSLKKAADKLDVSPATLSARLQGFEQDLSINLFEHNHKSLLLTEEGMRFYTYAMEILQEYNTSKKELLNIQSRSYYQLKIGIAGSGLPLYLGPFLDKINLLYSSLHLQLYDDSSYSIESGLKSGHVDLYFAPVMIDYSVDGIAKTLISYSTQHVIVPREHPLSGMTAVSMKQLDGETFVLYPLTAETCIRNFQIKNLKESGIHYSIYDEYSSTIFYKLLVPIGKGLVLSPIPVIDLPPNTTSLSVKDIKHPAANYMFYNKNTKNPEVLSFVNDFTNYIKENRNYEYRKAL